MSSESPWKTTDSQEVYTNAWMRVREDQVIRPDGQPGIYGVVMCGAATGVVALTEKDEVVLVGQYRYTMEEYSWEIVEGGQEADDATPLAAAQRELREEAGLDAEHWEQLGGEIHVSNSITDQRGFLYLARGLRPTTVETTPDGTEDLAVAVVPFAEALRRVDSGEIKDGMAIIGLLRAARLLGL